MGKCGGFEKKYVLLPLKIETKLTGMQTFIGKYEAKADVKGRIFIPSVYRKLLPAGERERLVMRKDANNDCLIIFPQSVWNKKVAALQEKLDEWNPDDQLLLMQFVSNAEMLDIDTQGRVLIARRHLEQIGMNTNEVLFVGMLDRFAIWSRKQFEATELSATDFADKLRSKMSRKEVQ